MVTWKKLQAGTDQDQHHEQLVHKRRFDASVSTWMGLCRVQRPGGDSVALLQAAAHLYQAQGHFQLALAILLRLQRPDVFDFVAKHGLLGGLKLQQVHLLSISQPQCKGITCPT